MGRIGLYLDAQPKMKMILADRNPFAELLLLMPINELVSWRTRCREAGNRRLADIFDDEICERRIGQEFFNASEGGKATGGQ